MNEAMNLWMFILAIWIALESRKVGNKVNVLDIIDQDHQKSRKKEEGITVEIGKKEN